MTDESDWEAVRANRDYWRSVAGARTADLRDLRAALRAYLAVTGVDDEALVRLLAETEAPRGE